MPKKQSTNGAMTNNANGVYRLLGSLVKRVVKDYSGARYYTVKHPNGYCCTYKIGTQDSREFLTMLCEAKKVKITRRILDELEMALRAEDKVQVHTRIGSHDGAIYIDTGEPDWTILRIDSEGWRYIPYSECPIVFIRPTDMKSLPRANDADAKSVFKLFKFMNLSEEDKFLALAWLLSTFNPTAPLPILAITGAQGTAKTTLVCLLRRFIDPAETEHQAPPTNERDLCVSARASYVLAFDNVSSISPRMADAFCRVSTGAGLRERLLYTNGESFTAYYRRPVVLNGITDFIRAADLGDRVVQIETLRIQNRKTERRFWAEVESVESDIFTGLLHGVVSALKHSVDLELLLENVRLPRMADVAVWTCAAMKAYDYSPEQTLEMIFENKQLVNANVAEQRPLVALIAEFMESRPQWSGTASDLFDVLFADESRLPDGVPNNPSWLGRELRQIEPLLYQLYGIEIVRERSGIKRTIVLRRLSATSDVNDGLFAQDNRLSSITSCCVGHRADELASHSSSAQSFDEPTDPFVDDEEDTVVHRSIRNGSYRVKDTALAMIDFEASARLNGDYDCTDDPFA